MDASSANTSESSDEGPESSSSGVVEIQTMAVPQESQRLANHPTLLRLLRSGPQDEDVVNETISGVRNKQATEDEEAAAMDTDSGCSNGTSSNNKTPSRRRTASKRSIAASRRHGRKLLTLQQKLDVIRRMKEGEKAKSLAAEYDIARTTVWQFRNQESQITDFISKIPENSDGQATNRSSMRRPRVESVEKELRVWMATEQANGNVVNNRELRKMARTIHQQLSGKADDDDDARAFKASSGWLRRFKRRNGIQVPKPFRMPTPKVETPEDVQVHLDLVRKFVGKNGIDAERVYTVDKMRLHWRALPLKSSPASDDFVEVLLCINSTGTHRLRLALIGHGGGNGSGGEDEAAEQSAMPFRRYCAQKVDVTLDADSFAEWFRNEFVPAVSTSPHRCPTLLLVNAFSSNVGLHSTLQTDDSAVRCVVLSSAAAFVTQPVNLALVKALGCNYRKSLVPTVIANRRLLENPNHVTDKTQAGHAVTLKGAGCLLSEAWSATRVNALRHLWRDTLQCIGVLDDDDGEKGDDDNGDGEIAGDDLVDDAAQITAELQEIFADDVNEELVISWLAMDEVNPTNRTAKDVDLVDLIDSDEDGDDEELDTGASIRSDCRRRNRTNRHKSNALGLDS